MATRVLVETGYSYDPVNFVLTIPKAIPQERLISIIHMKSSTLVLGTFNGANNTNIVYPQSYTVSGNSTIIGFGNAVSQLKAGDKLQIIIDDAYTEITPAETQLDSINKLRVSMPQALIDTDFEYGPQITKWENLALTNMRPFAFITASSVPFVTNMTTALNSRSVTVVTTSTSAVSTGGAVVVQDSTLSAANGTFVVDSITANTSFSYTARAAAPSAGSIYDSARTLVSAGSTYSNANIGTISAIATTAQAGGALINVTMATPHGLALGNEIAVVGVSAATANPPNGSFTVSRVVSPTQFYYWTPNIPTGALSTSANTYVYVRPQAAFLHRPFDGGVIFSSNGSSNFQQAVRQTRRYFRYQSGKGIMFSSGTLLKPTFQLDGLSSDGTTVTATTKEQHNIQPGAQVTVYGANESGFNGTFTVVNVTGYTTFTYTPASAPANGTLASGQYYCTVSSWYGAVNRMGLFDQQNGVFFEFDGQTLNAVRRNSTYQISGTVTATNGSSTVTGSTNAVFSKQLAIGDFIVLRGQSYRVEAIASDSSLTINPAYRGSTASNVVVSKTVDTKIPQSSWNLDKCDGTGPSGYNIDISKMQMFYIDYSWYGAGFIRWGLRATNGNIVYVHKMPNNNVNSEAYLRSGNLPGRYETVTAPPTTFITATASATETTAIYVNSTAKFPSATSTSPGTIVIKGTNGYEFVNYTGTTSTSFQGLTRGLALSAVTATFVSNSNVIGVPTAGLQVGMRVHSANVPDGTFVSSIVDANTATISKAATTSGVSATAAFPAMGISAAQVPYSATNPTSVELAWPLYAPPVSHWGTAALMDGRYDDDKSLLFTYGSTNVLGLTPTIAGGSGATSAFATTGATIAAALTSVVSNSITVTAPANTIVSTGAAITGTGIPTGTIVTGVSNASNPYTLTLSKPITSVTAGTALTFTNASSRALFSIRIAPSVDNGRASTFGARELINRMQLVLRALDITILNNAPASLLVSLVINGQPYGAAVLWGAANQNATSYITSSLAQVGDYSSTATQIQVSGGEVTGGYLVSSTGSIPLDLVRDLGNSILGGGATASASDNASTVSASATNLYPDGPDVVTVVVQNLSPTVGVGVSGRLSWTEAQA